MNSSTFSNHSELKPSFYPFGMEMPGRTFTSESYRFAFNGMEKDDEVNGTDNTYTTHFRMLDTRLGRWWSQDPVTHPFQSPYNSMDNNPIWFNDPFGDDVDGDKEGMDTYNDLKSDVASQKAGTQQAIDKVTATISELENQGAKQSKIDRKTNELNRLNTRLNDLTNIQNEFTALEESDQMYYIQTGNKEVAGAGGFLGFDNSTGFVTVNLADRPGGSVLPSAQNRLRSILSHELKHAYQFETGKISLGWNRGGGNLYDLQDEVEAFSRQQFLYGDYGYSTIDYKFVLGTGGYNGISNRKTQISLNTPNYEGPIKGKLYKSGRDGKNPTEVIKGWEIWYYQGKQGLPFVP